MKRLLLSTLAIWLASIAVQGQTFDGSAPLLCAIRTIMECVEASECEAVTPEAIQAPSFLRIDFAAKTIRAIRGDLSERTTRILSISHIDGKLFLQGAEDGVEGVRDGVGWTMAIQNDSGRAVLAAAGDEVAFVAFAACTGI